MASKAEALGSELGNLMRMYRATAPAAALLLLMCGAAYFLIGPQPLDLEKALQERIPLWWYLAVTAFMAPGACNERLSGYLWRGAGVEGLPIVETRL